MHKKNDRGRLGSGSPSLLSRMRRRTNKSATKPYSKARSKTPTGSRFRFGSNVSTEQSTKSSRPTNPSKNSRKHGKKDRPRGGLVKILSTRNFRSVKEEVELDDINLNAESVPENMGTFGKADNFSGFELLGDDDEQNEGNAKKQEVTKKSLHDDSESLEYLRKIKMIPKKSIASKTEEVSPKTSVPTFRKSVAEADRAPPHKGSTVSVISTLNDRHVSIDSTESMKEVMKDL